MMVIAKATCGGRAAGGGAISFKWRRAASKGRPPPPNRSLPPGGWQAGQLLRFGRHSAVGQFELTTCWRPTVGGPPKKVADCWRRDRGQPAVGDKRHRSAAAAGPLPAADIAALALCHLWLSLHPIAARSAITWATLKKAARPPSAFEPAILSD